MSSVPQAPVIAPPPRAADPLLGTTLGERYTIRRRIGAGGMGLVYLADQNGEPREVVVKVLAPHWLHDEAAKGRFDREVQALATLRHPNIVEMYDFGRENERAYLVMEYLRGVPLSKYLARTPMLAMAEFVPIAAQILKGTGYAHTREIIVRDIKPANVMLCERRGRANFVKMLDFGLAKLVHDDNPITQDQALGTLGYIAPETVSGQAPDLRVDVYALGVLFYQMLSGRLPFEVQSGGSAAMLYRTVNEEPDRLDEILPAGHDVPPGFIEFLHRCLSKNPDDRPADANVMVEQMIDVVPASMFRLPRAEPRDPAASAQTGNQSSAGIPGFTGILAGTAASASSSDVVELSGNSGTASASHWATPPSQPVAQTEAPARRGNLGLIIGLVVGGAGIAVALATQCGDGRSEQATVATASPEKSAEGENAEAKAQPKADPAPEEVRPPADTPPTPEPAPRPAGTLGSLVVSSSPTAANVLIDGEVVGVTPYDGKTTLGTHTLAVEAPGYHRWSSQIDITPEPGDPLGVKLVPHAGSKRRSGGGGGRPRPHSGGGPSSDAGTTPATAPAKPGPAAPPKTAKDPGDESLLKGKKSDSGLLPSSGQPRKSDALLKGG